MATHNSRAVWHIYIHIYIYTYVHTIMLSYIHVIIHINAYIACMHTYIDIHTYILSLSLAARRSRNAPKGGHGPASHGHIPFVWHPTLPDLKAPESDPTVKQGV